MCNQQGMREDGGFEVYTRELVSYVVSSVLVCYDGVREGAMMTWVCQVGLVGDFFGLKLRPR